MPPIFQTILLLVLANVFMTFALFSVHYLQQPLKLDFLWAGLCMCGAVYFIFRS